MDRMFPLFGNAKAGLTFLELLLAVSISGLIISAGAQLMFHFAQFWQQTEKEPLYIHHVDGVSSFVQYCMDNSELLTDNESRPYCWCKPPKQETPALHFRLEKAPSLFVTELLPDPPVDAWLWFEEDKGLTLLWHVPKKLTRNRIKVYQTPISPWVEDLELGYFDAEKNVWEYESALEKAEGENREAPEAVRIQFNQNGRRQMRDFRMMRQDRDVLVY